MADEVDVANANRDLYEQAQLEAFRRRNKPEQVQNEDGTWPHTECVVCDDEIPQGRLAYGKIRCVICQERHEKQKPN